jgi:hypothetical protein
MSRRDLPPVAALLAEAQRSAGWHAADAAQHGDYVLATEWSALAVELGGAIAEAVRLLGK